MPLAKDINEYLRAWAAELGERILQTYPPLQGFDDAASPLNGQLLRKPFPAQTLAMMGVVKRWTEARGAAVIAECGTGKTLISLGAVHVHSDCKPFTALSAVQNALVTFAERKDLSSAEGCMGLNAISEFGHRDKDVTRITLKAAGLQRQTLIRVLTKAKKQGELSSDADPDSMADFFESTLAGIRMAAKTGRVARHFEISPS
jgi:hypothetical protein